MLALQYDLFEENSEVCLLKQEINQIKQSSDNVRKSLFAKHSDLMKILIKQQDEIDQLKRMIFEVRNK